MIQTVTIHNERIILVHFVFQSRVRFAEHVKSFPSQFFVLTG